ncbi:MAG: 6-pyruvoyl-tetrahydropterin synthase-related protein, partial [Anaerolineales bacterium]
GRRAPAAAALTACWAFAILAHPQQALIYAVGFGMYAVGRLFFDPDLPLRRAGLWLVTVAVGALLTAAWTLPAYSGGELPNVPYQPADIAAIYSTRLDYFVPSLDMTGGKVLFGLGAILLALLATAARPEPRRSAYFLAGVLALWFSLGTQGVAYTLLPLNQQLIPERFVNFAAFAFAVAASGLLPLGRTARPARVFIVVGLLAVDFLPSAGAVHGLAVPETIAATRRSLARHSDEMGRTALFTYPEPGSANVYYAARSTPTIFGWTLQNTPHHLAIRRVLGVPTWGPEYLIHLLRLWDVQWAVVQGTPREADPAREVLARAGFEVEESQGYEIWSRSGPAAPVQVLPENRMLLLGDRLPPMLGVFPFAEEAEGTRLADLNAADLSSYPVLGLYQFESSQAALGGDAARLTEYVQGGGTVILDLSGMEDLVGRTLNFLDVDVLRVSFSEAMPLRWSGEFAGLPEQLPIAEISPEGWSGAAYAGLDTVLA